MTQIEKDNKFMRRALMLARKAGNQKEVPVGAVLVLDDKIIGEGQNSQIQSLDATNHAEIMAIRRASQKLKNYRLLNTTLYVTLEPCLMCVGALIHARIKRLVFGAYDPQAGCVESCFRGFDQLFLNHRVIYECGLLAKESRKLLQEFFKARR